MKPGITFFRSSSNISTTTSLVIRVLSTWQAEGFERGLRYSNVTTPSLISFNRTSAPPRLGCILDNIFSTFSFNSRPILAIPDGAPRASPWSPTNIPTYAPGRCSASARKRQGFGGSSADSRNPPKHSRSIAVTVAARSDAFLHDQSCGLLRRQMHFSSVAHPYKYFKP